MVALIRFCILLAVSSIRAEEEAIDEISIKPEESWPRLASSSSSNEQAQSSNDTLASDSEGNKMKRKRKKLRYILKKLAWYFSPFRSSLETKSLNAILQRTICCPSLITLIGSGLDPLKRVGLRCLTRGPNNFIVFIRLKILLLWLLKTLKDFRLENNHLLKNFRESLALGKPSGKLLFCIRFRGKKTQQYFLPNLVFSHIQIVRFGVGMVEDID